MQGSSTASPSSTWWEEGLLLKEGEREGRTVGSIRARVDRCLYEGLDIM